MSLSSFQINQPPGTPYGTWDRSRRDIDLYSVASEAVECEAQNKSETTYLWEMVSAPDGVTVTVNNSTTHTCNFQLTVTGSYLIRLTVNAGLGNESITTLEICVALEGSREYLPALNETNQDNSQSPYNGERGHEDKINSLLRWLNQHVSIPKDYVGTSKAITAAESGRWFEANAGSVVFTLPTAAEGLAYVIGTDDGQTAQIDRAGSDLIYGPFVADFGTVTSVTLVANSFVRIRTVSDGAGGWDWYIDGGEGIFYETGTSANQWALSLRRVEDLGTDGAAATVPMSDGAGGLTMAAIDAYVSDAVITVSSGGSPVLNGNNLKAAYTAAKSFTPGGNPLGADNRAAVLIPPGQYDLGASTWDIDTDYVDLIGLGMGSRRQDDGTVLYADVLIWSGGNPAVEQTVDDVRMKNITFGQDTSTQDIFGIDVAGTYAQNSMYIGLGFLMMGELTNVYCVVGGSAARIDAYFEECHTTHKGFLYCCEFAGTLKRCSAGEFSFAGANKASDVTFSGYAEDCIGTNYCFGASSGGGNATFSGEARNCKVTTNGYGSTEGGSPGDDAVCSGTLTDCDNGASSGSLSFGASATGDGTCSAFLRRCRAGNYSFGFSNNASYTGQFSGEAIDCQAAQYCFGSNLADTSQANCSGTLTGCEATRYSFGARGSVTGTLKRCRSGEYGSFGNTSAGAPRFEDCFADNIATAQGGPIGISANSRLKRCTFVATTGSPVILNGSGAKFYHCDFHSEDDTSPSIDAASTQTAKIAHCQMNIDIDLNVTNDLADGKNVVDSAYDQ